MAPNSDGLSYNAAVAITPSDSVAPSFFRALISTANSGLVSLVFANGSTADVYMLQGVIYPYSVGDGAISGAAGRVKLSGLGVTTLIGLV